ncbi:UMP kinase [Neobittarella massiliensis]|uniref:Uridylate kinase n=2 Tax=Oscillospiraceae TaxID=216572 RepID=A0A8J6IEC6_9FIRM|nr:UMP kinase [Neobittarella massiliensis]MBC3515630.1 UMP kinase [Neobittarella massiliensis]SCJ51004.1 Uridylate kinase [uncultured Anaerotruncus sp.]
MELKYKRVLLKISGEALAGERKMGIDYDIVTDICKNIKTCVEMGAQIAIVVGGGNFWRGRSSGEMERTRADHMGMLATVINALAVADALEQLGVPVRVQTALPMQQVAEPYIRNKAVRHLEKGRVVILACGTGNPYFSTDTAASLRAAEINAEIIFKATMVDGVYDKDPKKFGDAVRYDKVSFTKVLTDSLGVMDSTAASLCKDNDLPILLFDLSDPHNIVKAMCGEQVGTIVIED